MYNKKELMEYYGHFPSVLRNALEKGLVVFPDNLEKKFEPIEVYRGIRYKIGEKEKSMKEDFLSQMERNLPGYDPTEIESYSCSCFEDKQELINAMHMPRKNKKIACGHICADYGPCVKEKESSHIHWYLFEGVDPSDDFEVCSDEEMD